ncbi:MAG: M23 family metallopeptidase [Acidobacteria bacterium]|nr:M23 family metallopeptidase [Acidobacteriota bacterium]MYJ05511.1 M23 family metallopeptidase [Acidobacteriota bacterium]
MMVIRRCRYCPRLRYGLVCVALVVLLAAPAAAQNGDGELIQSISHRARALHPGEVVVLNVRIDGPTRSLTGSAFGKDLHFFPAGPANVSSALIGVDLTVDAGAHPVTVRAEGAGGNVDERTYTLEVEPKQFPTRELTVNPSFVDPPAEVIERIQREARQLAAIFPVASPERLWSGGFLRPVPGAATSAFGRRSVFNGQPRSPHSGADFRAAEGTPIRAPNDGVVVLAADLYFSGNVVILDHGWGLYSYFAHLSAIDVAEGDSVSQGETVGKVGATGRVTGPHLHWTVRLNDARVDPVALMELFPAAGAR